MSRKLSMMPADVLSARESVVRDGLLNLLLLRRLVADNITTDEHAENDDHDDTGYDSGDPVGFAHVRPPFAPSLLCGNGAAGSSVVFDII
jgi:hypothetical protein